MFLPLHIPPNNRCLLAVPLLLFLLLAPAPLYAEITLASNEQVLEAWQVLAQNETGTPVLVQQADGGSTIEWHGGVSIDGYNNSVKGGQLLTPMNEGTFHQARIQGDLRETAPDGTLSYLQFSALNSNDRSVISQNNMLELLQAGIVAPDYSVAVGDVTASFSTLGTNTSLRGLYGTTQVGTATFSASLGFLSESWQTVVGRVEPGQYVRDVYAFKAEIPAGDKARFFFTTQGYSEDEDSIELANRIYATADASASTAGFSYQGEAYTVQGELGSSSWGESGSDDYSDTAAVLDGEWRLQKGSLRAGYHDIGSNYASLSGDVPPGVVEGYLAGDWLATDWLNLNLDMRRTENEVAFYASDIETTDAVTAMAGIALDSMLQGLSLSLQHSQSMGTAVDKSDSDQNSFATILSYNAQYWMTSLSNNREEVENSAWPDTNSTTNSWNYDLSIELNQRAEMTDVWGTTLALSAAHQHQELDSGSDTKNRNYTLSLTARHTDWGSLVASYGEGETTQTTGGADLKQTHYNLEASRNWKENNTIKIYLRKADNSGDSVSEYSERTAGAQVTLAW